MVKLDLEGLNKTIPYPLAYSPEAKDGYFFITDQKVQYTLYLIKVDLFSSDDTYEFAIHLDSGKPLSRDPKIREEILGIAEHYFKHNKNSVLYFCDTSDNRQAKRDRLFQRWLELAARKSDILSMRGVITEDDGVDNYVTLVSRVDNPNFDSVMSEFKQLVVLLKDKPE